MPTRRHTALATWVVIASALDLALTLLHLAAGGAEANPLMAWVLDAGGLVAFAAVKMALTMGGAVVLLALHRHRTARLGLVCVAWMYAALMVYHAYCAVDRGAIG